MGWNFLHSTQTSGSAVTSLPVTVTAVPIGALVVVSLKFTSSVTGVSVTDSAGNTYLKAFGPSSNGTANTVYQFYGVATSGGSTTVTPSWTSSAALRVTVEQFSGGMSSNATVFDTTISTSAFGTGTSSAASIAPTAAGELIVASIGLASGAASITVGSGYSFGTSQISLTTEYKLSGTTSETAPLSWTNSLTWAEIAAAYIAAPAGAPNPDQFFLVL